MKRLPSGKHYSSEALFYLIVSFNSYLTEKCIFYGAGELSCPGGSALRWRSNGNRGYAWRCNGVITNYETGERCCNGTTRSSKLASFFYRKKIPCAQVLLILYFWLHHSRRMDIADMVKVHPSTVARVLYGCYQIMQEELSKGDMQIGMNIGLFCTQI